MRREPLPFDWERMFQHISPEPMSGCWLWTSCTHTFGYGFLTVNKKTRMAHLLAWELEHGEIPQGMCVLHKCDVPQCCNPDHLFLGTKGDNAKDRDKKKRHWVKSGKSHYKRKLTDEQVQKIKVLASGGMYQHEIAKQFGIVQQQVSRIVNGLRCFGVS